MNEENTYANTEGFGARNTAESIGRNAGIGKAGSGIGIAEGGPVREALDDLQEARDTKPKGRGRPRKADIEAKKLAEERAQEQALRDEIRGMSAGLFLSYKTLLNLTLIRRFETEARISPEAEHAAKQNLEELAYQFGGEIPEKWRPVIGLAFVTTEIITQTAVASSEKRARKTEARKENET